MSEHFYATRPLDNLARPSVYDGGLEEGAEKGVKQGAQAAPDGEGDEDEDFGGERPGWRI